MTKNNIYKILSCIFLFIYAIGVRYTNWGTNSWQFWMIVIGGVGQAALMGWRLKDE